MDPGIFGSDIANGAVGGGLGAVFVGEVLRRVWRRFSRERVDSVRDRAEESFITTLRRERDDAMSRADRAFLERNQAIEREALALSSVGRLEGRISALQETVARLESEVRQYIIKSAPSGG